MNEREMENLLYSYPSELLGEKLEPFRRQHRSRVGRWDLVFTDCRGALLLIEIKRGVLSRGAGFQLLTYVTELKGEFGDRQIRKMVVANKVPETFRPTLHELGIEWAEIPIPRFAEVAAQSGYKFASDLSLQRSLPSLRSPAGFEASTQSRLMAPINEIRRLERHSSKQQLRSG